MPNIGLLPFMSATMKYVGKIEERERITKNLKFIVLNGF